MTNSLQSLFQAIAQAKDEQALRSQLLVAVKEYFVAKRSGLFFCTAFSYTPPFAKCITMGAIRVTQRV